MILALALATVTVESK